jgi:hypothetical protein
MGEEKPTWEPVENLGQIPNLIAEFEEQRQSKRRRRAKAQLGGSRPILLPYKVGLVEMDPSRLACLVLGLAWPLGALQCNAVERVHHRVAPQLAQRLPFAWRICRLLEVVVDHDWSTKNFDDQLETVCDGVLSSVDNVITPASFREYAAKSAVDHNELAWCTMNNSTSQ